MFTSKRLLLLVSLLLLALVLAGCGDKPTEVPQEAEEDVGFVLALPRVTVDVDSEGTPSVAGIDPDTLKTISLGFVDVSGMALPEQYIDWFTTAGIQHIELVHTADGLHLFVNGQAMPYVGWDGDSLGATADLAAAFNQLDPRVARVIKLLVPFIQRTGINVAMRFPVQAGAEVVPMRDTDAPLGLPGGEDENTLAVARIHVNYGADGVPSVLAVSTNDIEDVLGVPLRQANLDPATIKMLQDAGVQHITARTTPSGLRFYTNDQALPYLAWGTQYLENGADLYGQLYFNQEYTAAREALNLVLPYLDNIDGEVVLLFPLPAGAEQIPIPQS
jgi:hypothetical protein